MNSNLKTSPTGPLNGLWVDDRRYNTRMLGAMMAVEVLMAYSPFGFIILPTISVATLFIGVLAAALWGGPVSGGMVGLVFGLTSMWKASVTATNPNDLIFSPLRSGNPVGSILLALAPRILFGIIAGLIYYVILKYAPRNVHVRLPVILVFSALLERVNSSLTYLFMDKVFHVEGASMFRSWTNLFSVNRIKTYIIVMLIMAFAYLLYDHFLSKKYYEQYRQIRGIASKFSLKYTLLTFAAVLIVTLTASHLWERLQIILFDIDLISPEQTSTGLMMQVFSQFMLASLSALYVVVLISKHARNVEEFERSSAVVQLGMEKERAKEMEQRSLKDPLTGVYNRKGMEKIAAEKHLDSKPTGFLLIDIDHFKDINDHFGHNAGDTVLRETAKALVEFLGENRVFRLGGDEFAVLVEEYEPNAQQRAKTWEALTQNLERIHERLSGLLSKSTSITLSVGVCFLADGYSEKLYPLADSALYETKNNGRAGCTLIHPDGTVLARWKDPKAKPYKPLAELSNTGICRLKITLDDSAKPQLFCREDIRTFMCISRETSPEACFEIWFAGVDPKDIQNFDAVKETLLKTGMALYTYTWNHPLKGPVRVESCASGKTEDGVLSVISHYQLFFDTPSE